MDTKRLVRLAFAVSREVVALLGVAFAFASIACHATAQDCLPAEQREHDVAAVRVADLERVFWACDYVATERGVAAAPLELCSAAMDEIKSVKFGGDFLALLDWWRANKQVEHGRLESGIAFRQDQLPACASQSSMR